MLKAADSVGTLEVIEPASRYKMWSCGAESGSTLRCKVPRSGGCSEGKLAHHGALRLSSWVKGEGSWGQRTSGLIAYSRGILVEGLEFWGFRE
mmetsp:Transcript_12179/g.19109  ORF Transcript_12179/g.19109 Transcript_12179/m.19109 type:complete len:93 (+) Transcript_12179:102-380(+)